MKTAPSTAALGRVAALALVTMAAACEGPKPARDAAVPSWACAAGWVRSTGGGCGPAAVLCARGEDGDPDDCARISASADAGAFVLAADGGVRGRWREPGEPGGPPAVLGDRRVPAADWAPDAAVSSCPEGWTRSSDGWCEPNVRSDCEGSSLPLPGRRCTATGASSCPATEFPQLPASVDPTLVRRVRAGADPSMADGSEARPYATIGAALAAAPADGWVVVGAGTFRERITLERAAHLVGLCPSRTRIESEDPAAAAVTNVGHPLELRGFSLSSANVAVSHEGASATLERLVVEAAIFGLRIAGASTTAVLRDVAFVSSDARRPNAALAVLEGASVDAESVSVDAPRFFGLYATGGGSITVAGALVRGATGLTSMQATAGAYSAGGRLTIRRSTLAQNAMFQIEAREGATLALEDVALSCAGSCSNFARVMVRERATLDASRLQCRGNSGACVSSAGRAVLRAVKSAVESAPTVGNAAFRWIGRGASGSLEGATLEGPMGGVQATEGAQVALRSIAIRGSAVAAILSTNGGSVDVTDVRVDDARNDGLSVSAGGASLRATNVVVRGGSAESGREPCALCVYEGGTLSVERARVSGALHAGLRASTRGDATLTDAVIEQTRPIDLAATAEQDRYGAGVRLEAGAATLSRVTLSDNVAVGLVALGATLRASDIAIVRTLNTLGRGAPTNFALGALLLGNGSEARVERALIDESEGYGVFGWSARTISLSDIAVRGALSDTSGRYGAGVAIRETGESELRRVWIDRVQNYGVALVDNGDVTHTLEDILVTHVAPSREVQSVAVAAVGGRTRVERLAVHDAVAAGLSLIPVNFSSEFAPPVVEARDLWIGGVRQGRIRCADGGPTCVPTGPFVGYGIYVHEGSLTLERATVVRGGFGFYAHGGAIAWRTGVVRGQLDAAGAWRLAAPTLTDVALVQNARDDVLAMQELTAMTTFGLPTPL